MSPRLPIALAAVLSALASSAPAQVPQAPQTYAALSLIGDQLDAVTYQPQIGTHLDANTHQAMLSHNLAQVVPTLVRPPAADPHPVAAVAG